MLQTHLICRILRSEVGSDGISGLAIVPNHVLTVCTPAQFSLDDVLHLRVTEEPTTSGRRALILMHGPNGQIWTRATPVAGCSRAVRFSRVHGFRNVSAVALTTPTTDYRERHHDENLEFRVLRLMSSSIFVISRHGVGRCVIMWRLMSPYSDFGIQSILVTA